MVIIGILANRADIPICVVRSHAETVERRVMAKVISIWIHQEIFPLH